jgi:uncharacterized protein YukJ
MPLKSYGVLKGHPINNRLGAGESPHYQIHLIDDDTDYRIAINVKSKLEPSSLLYLLDDDYEHPMLELLSDLPLGFKTLDNKPGTAAIDYIRGNHFDPEQMKPLSHNIPGPDNDLNEKIHAYVQRAIEDEQALLYAFGERWGPENKKDKHFGFQPGNGIHDIHMNQGNTSQWSSDDGVWQDGGLLFQFPRIVDKNGVEVWPEQWVAVFLAFQSQAWHTDDITGHRIGEDVIVETQDNSIRIIAALVNPEGRDPGMETVTLLNTTPVPADLSGWSLVDKNKKRTALNANKIEPGDSSRIQLDGKGVQLGNKGGTISLLDQNGNKIHGVSYSKKQAKRSGWSIVFL